MKKLSKNSLKEININGGFTDSQGAGDILGVAPCTLDRWRSEKKGPSYYKFGGAARYKISELYLYAEKTRVKCGGI